MKYRTKRTIQATRNFLFMTSPSLARILRLDGAVDHERGHRDRARDPDIEKMGRFMGLLQRKDVEQGQVVLGRRDREARRGPAGVGRELVVAVRRDERADLGVALEGPVVRRG